MSNVVYKGKGQVPLYRIYRHSITPQGPHRGGASTSPVSSVYPRGGSQQQAGQPGTLSQPACSLFLLGPIPPYPQAPHEEPHELRLRRGSDPSGHTPRVWEKKYTPLNTEHMGKGRDAMGEEQAGTLRGGWAEPPASPEGGTASRSHYKRRKSYTQRGKW